MPIALAPINTEMKIVRILTDERPKSIWRVLVF